MNQHNLLPLFILTENRNIKRVIWQIYSRANKIKKPLLIFFIHIRAILYLPVPPILAGPNFANARSTSSLTCMTISDDKYQCTIK